MFTKLKNLNIHYKVKGSGKPLILLHGWGCDINIFTKLQEELSNKFTVYAVDLPGFGLSAIPETVWGSDEYADLMVHFIDELKIVDPVLLGHSFGGKVIIKLAANDLVKAEKIILVSSPGIRLPKPFKIKLKIYFFKLIKLVANMPLVKHIFGKKFELYRRKFGSNDYKNSKGIMRAILVKSIHENILNLLPKIKVPTLLFWGEKDDSTPIEAGKIMRRSIADSKLTVFPNSGHFPFLDDQKKFMMELKDFLG